MRIRPVAVWIAAQTAKFLHATREHRLYAAFHLVALRGRPRYRVRQQIEAAWRGFDPSGFVLTNRRGRPLAALSPPAHCAISRELLHGGHCESLRTAIDLTPTDAERRLLTRRLSA